MKASGIAATLAAFFAGLATAAGAGALAWRPWGWLGGSWTVPQAHSICTVLVTVQQGGEACALAAWGYRLMWALWALAGWLLVVTVRQALKP